MVPLYTFVVDIFAPENITTEKEFRAVVDQHLVYLRSFPIAYGRSDCSESYYPPSDDKEAQDYNRWSYRFVLMLSVGKNKISKIGLIYEALLKLLAYELPDFVITADADQWNFHN